MRTTELLALTATVDRDGIVFDPNDPFSRYIDWSETTDKGRAFEFGGFGVDDEAVTVDLTWEQIARLQQALTVLLLER